MSCFVSFNLHLDPTPRLSVPIETALMQLGAAGFHHVDQVTGDLIDDKLSVERFLTDGEAMDRGFGVVGRDDLEMAVSFRSEPRVPFIQTVALAIGDFHFAAPLLEQRVVNVHQLVRNLHRALDARRTIGARGLEDGLLDYDWIDEWRRLDSGRVEGAYWFDIVRSDLASAEYEHRQRSSVPKPVLFKRFSWGTYSLSRLAP